MDELRHMTDLAENAASLGTLRAQPLTRVTLVATAAELDSGPLPHNQHPWLLRVATMPSDVSHWRMAFTKPDEEPTEWTMFFLLPDPQARWMEEQWDQGLGEPLTAHRFGTAPLRLVRELGGKLHHAFLVEGGQAAIVYVRGKDEFWRYLGPDTKEPNPNTLCTVVANPTQGLVPAFTGMRPKVARPWAEVPRGYDVEPHTTRPADAPPAWAVRDRQNGTVVGLFFDGPAADLVAQLLSKYEGLDKGSDEDDDDDEDLRGDEGNDE